MRLCRKKGFGFTLIELLVVIAIISLLVSIILPSLNSAKRMAKVAICTSNLKQYALGMTIWASDDDSGLFPQHLGYSNGVVYYDVFGAAAGYPDVEEYLDKFIKTICAGNPGILYCPLDKYFDPTMYEGPLYPGELIWNGGDTYMSGYARYARLGELGGGPYDWSESGNSQNEGPPRLSGDAQDAIVSDLIFSDVDYMDAHAVDFYDPATYRENSVGYGDGHAETKYHVMDLDYITHWRWKDTESWLYAWGQTYMLY